MSSSLPLTVSDERASARSRHAWQNLPVQRPQVVGVCRNSVQISQRKRSRLSLPSAGMSRQSCLASGKICGSSDGMVTCKVASYPGAIPASGRLSGGCTRSCRRWLCRRRLKCSDPMRMCNCCRCCCGVEVGGVAVVVVVVVGCTGTARPIPVAVDSREGRIELEREAGAFSFAVPSGASPCDPPLAITPFDDVVVKDGDCAEAHATLTVCRLLLSLLLECTRMRNTFPAAWLPCAVGGTPGLGSRIGTRRRTMRRRGDGTTLRDALSSSSLECISVADSASVSTTGWSASTAMTFVVVVVNDSSGRGRSVEASVWEFILQPTNPMNGTMRNSNKKNAL